MTPSPQPKPGSAPPPGVPSDAAAEASLQRLRSGDVQAFETLFRCYYEALYHFAYQYVHARETAEELVQDIFCRLWERRGALPTATSSGGIKTVRAYLYRATRNAAISWLRHERVTQRLTLSATADAPPPGMGMGPPGPDVATHTKEVQVSVRRAIASLPELYRQVLTLRWDHHLSYEEIATVLQISRKTVETRVTRAFRRLRNVLEDLR